MKREKEELETQIIQLKRKQGEDKKTMNGKEKKRKDGNVPLKHKKDALQKSNQEQLTKKVTSKKLAKMRTAKTEAVKELEEQDEILKAENEKSMKFKTNQPEPEELSQSRKEETQIEDLGERVRNKSESDCKRLQEKLDKYINCKRRK